MLTPVDVVHVMLTVLFALAAVQALWHCVRWPKAGRRDRVDHLLHSAMSVTMAAMPWSLGRPLSGRVATVVLMLAALWFPLTALRHHSANRVTDIVGRLPHAVGMVAMAWMSRTHHGAGMPPHETLAAAPAAHGTTTPGHATGVPVPAAWVTGLLTVYLLACAIRSLTRPMPSLRSAPDAARRAAATNPYGHVRDGATALGTALMLLVPH
ncbi:DUF5134 domain-containing protein [Streptomyces sp. B3I8]|uniref:DUF5134 domain-containing protein n=1 Tax=Streptomyces sp. B3I8 TaxID=3042303 RepID=UPI00278AADFB|nr:DUF5134 domain-containing protein [Streptomyces sp. B3I8]MDQ0785196.1 hypothetical protein [Streptomyces sp. B3I8]